MHAILVPIVAGLALALSAVVAVAGDPEKKECRQGCEEAFRSCKSDCQGQRDSGTLQASQLYVECDSGCQSDYANCKDACNDGDDD